MSKAEVRTGLLFLFLVGGWLGRGWLEALPFIGEVTDTGVAMTAALAAFLVPSGRKGEALMTWDALGRLPWGVLILFGGGLALASAITSSGLALWLGQQLSGLGAVNTVLLIVAATALVIFLTELTSNTATAAAFLPVLAPLAIALGESPLLLAVPAALGASCAFMMPVATPPNAIVYGSGYITVPQMARAGLVLNLLLIVLITALSYLLLTAAFGLDLGSVPGWAR